MEPKGGKGASGPSSGERGFDGPATRLGRIDEDDWIEDGADVEERVALEPDDPFPI